MKRGRPKSECNVRLAEVSFSLTEDDAAWFNDVARQLGFKSRSQFFTAIAERLRIGGLSPMVFLKLGFQLAKRASETGSIRQAGFYFGTRPLPPLPEEELATAEKKQLLKEVKKELAIA